MATKSEQLQNLVRAFGGNPRNSTIADAIEDLIEVLPCKVEKKMVEIVPLQSLERENTGGAFAIANVDSTKHLEDGKTYVVVFNGKSYNFTASVDEYGEIVQMGNTTLEDIENGNATVDSIILTSDLADSAYVDVTYQPDAGKTITLAIYEEQEVVTPLDSKFIGASGDTIIITYTEDGMYSCNKTYAELQEMRSNDWTSLLNAIYAYNDGIQIEVAHAMSVHAKDNYIGFTFERSGSLYKDIMIDDTGIYEPEIG